MCEILIDIESRIAEIFLAKLNEGKQVITSEDVTSLIATMGSVSDFKAAEEQELGAAEFASEENKSKSQPSSSDHAREASKKLFRDQKRKIAGGICAGLGHYFNIDPVWPRLLFQMVALRRLRLMEAMSKRRSQIRWLRIFALVVLT